MKLSEDKIDLLKKALPELYALVLNMTSLLEGDLKYLKSLSKSEIEDLDNKNPSSKKIDLKLDLIKDRAEAIQSKLKNQLKTAKNL